MILPERQGWAFYQRFSKLLLSPKGGWRRIKWNLYATVHHPEKWSSFWEEWFRSSSEGDWVFTESQRGMTQDKVKLVCQYATPWKPSIFLRGRAELLTGGWVSCCRVPKRDDTGWSEKCMPRCNALKNGNLPERKGWALWGWVSCCRVPKRGEAG